MLGFGYAGHLANAHQYQRRATGFCKIHGPTVSTCCDSVDQGTFSIPEKQQVLPEGLEHSGQHTSNVLNHIPLKVLMSENGFPHQAFLLATTSCKVMHCLVNNFPEWSCKKLRPASAVQGQGWS